MVIKTRGNNHIKRMNKRKRYENGLKKKKEKEKNRKRKEKKVERIEIR